MFPPEFEAFRARDSRQVIWFDLKMSWKTPKSGSFRSYAGQLQHQDISTSCPSLRVSLLEGSQCQRYLKKKKTDFAEYHRCFMCFLRFVGNPKNRTGETDKHDA